MFTVNTKKSKDFNLKAEQILTNKKYDTFISEQEEKDLKARIISEAAAASLNRPSVRRRKMAHFRSKKADLIERKLFTEAVYSVFYDALLIDESFKERFDDKLYALTESTINTYLETNNLKLSHLKKRNGLLEDLVTLCEEIAEVEVKERYSDEDILNELENEEDDENLEIDAETKEEFDKEIDNVAYEIVDDVKSKVLETIEREKQIAMDQQEMEDEIETYTRQPEGTPEVTTAGLMTGGVENVNDSSDTEETAPEEEKIDGSAPATDKKALGESSSALLFEYYNSTKPLKLTAGKKLKEQTFFGYVLKAVSNKAANDAKLNESAINMDLIFSESVMLVTLFESLQSLGVTNYNRIELKEFGKQMFEDSRK